MQYQGSAKASLRWSLFPKGKRGVSNIVLMLGVAICLAVLLIGGFMLVTNLVQAQASSSSEYLATELVTLVNTIQTAPETATFEYYTETDQNGFPVIGSLEINDATNQLCVQPHTEDEMFSSITESASVAAGFGAAGYTVDRTRSLVAQQSTQKALAAKNSFETKFPQLAKLSREALYQLGVKSKANNALKSAIASGDASEIAKVFRTYPKLKSSFTQTDLDNILLLRSDEAFQGVVKSTEKPSFLQRILQKIPFTNARKSAQEGVLFEFYATKFGKSKIFQNIGGKIKTSFKVAGKVGVTAAVSGGVAFLLTGDWNVAITTAAQLTLFTYAPKLIDYVIIKATATKFIQRLNSLFPINSAIESVKNTIMDIPVVGPIIWATLSTAESAVNFIYAMWNAYLMDVTLTSIHDAAGNQVSKERSMLSCKEFQSSKEVLLTPPNCKPEVSFGPSVKDWQSAYAIGFGTAATFFGTATGAAVFNYRPTPDAVVSNTYLIASGALGVASFAATAIALGDAIYKAPMDMVPKSSCPSNCDTNYLRQDCPNWFISDSGAGAETAGNIFQKLLLGGPACASLSAAGWAAMFCDATRVSIAIGIFLADPADTINFMLQGNKVGLTKTEIKSKTAPEFQELGSIFANNTGYWYAEFPYTIEMTKIYASTAPAMDNRNPPIVIRKV